MKTSTLLTAVALSVTTGLLWGCTDQTTDPPAKQTTLQQADSSANQVVYIAELQPLNANVTGKKTHGQAKLTVHGDQLTIDIHVQDAPPGIEHWQHFHGFADGRDANVPTMSADKNKDGIIDLIETTSVSGTTMVPFDNDPAAMNIPNHDYPRASADGAYHYHKVVSLKKLQDAFAKQFPGQQLDWPRRVVYIHGVASDAKLPKTVASLGDIPASVTLPIAAGKLQRQNP